MAIHLVGDLGPSRLLFGVFGMDQGESKREDEEEREEEVSEFHGVNWIFGWL